MTHIDLIRKFLQFLLRKVAKIENLNLLTILNHIKQKWLFRKLLLHSNKCNQKTNLISLQTNL